jgi:hypothetical protein
VVTNTNPEVPTAQQSLVEGHDTLCKELVVVEACTLQLDPPFVVATTSPESSTAQQSLADGQATPNRLALVPDD